MASLLEYLAAILAAVLVATLAVFSAEYSHQIIKGLLEFFSYFGDAKNWRPIIL